MIVQVDFFVLSLCEKDIELFNSPSWLKFDFSLCQTFFFIQSQTWTAGRSVEHKQTAPKQQLCFCDIF